MRPLAPAPDVPAAAHVMSIYQDSVDGDKVVDSSKVEKVSGDAFERCRRCFRLLCRDVVWQRHASGVSTGACADVIVRSWYT